MSTNPESNRSASSNCALAPCAGSTRESHPHRAIRPASVFVAHLIATAHQVPQARERRRADPADVIAAYRAASVRLQTGGGQ